jgi:hypothetical protein
MKSKWFHLKDRAIKLRKQGKSLPYVSKTLGIPKSTLSGWFKDITLTKKQQQQLNKNWRDALGKARIGAVKWHNERKAERLAIAKQQALETIASIDHTDRAVLELSLAILYLAEGSKKNVETALGSSDPNTLRFYLRALGFLYSVNHTGLRCELYLRYDQDPEKLKRYWSKELSLPLDNFKQVNIDKRTQGKTTYDGYRGVCNIRGGGVAIRRRLVYLAEEYFAIIGRQK